MLAVQSISKDGGFHKEKIAFAARGRDLQFQKHFEREYYRIAIEGVLNR